MFILFRCSRESYRPSLPLSLWRWSYELVWYDRILAYSICCCGSHLGLSPLTTESCALYKHVVILRWTEMAVRSLCRGKALTRPCGGFIWSVILVLVKSHPRQKPMFRLFCRLAEKMVWQRSTQLDTDLSSLCARINLYYEPGTDFKLPWYTIELASVLSQAKPILDSDPSQAYSNNMACDSRSPYF